MRMIDRILARLQARSVRPRPTLRTPKPHETRADVPKLPKITPVRRWDTDSTINKLIADGHVYESALRWYASGRTDGGKRARLALKGRLL